MAENIIVGESEIVICPNGEPRLKEALKKGTFIVLFLPDSSPIFVKISPGDIIGVCLTSNSTDVVPGRWYRFPQKVFNQLNKSFYAKKREFHWNEPIKIFQARDMDRVESFGLSLEALEEGVAKFAIDTRT